MASSAAVVQSRPPTAKSNKIDARPAVPLPIVRQPTVVVTDLSEEERRRMEEERKRMAEEREKMREEREEWEKERDNLVEERKKFQEDRIILQGDLNNANKVNIIIFMIAYSKLQKFMQLKRACKTN